MAMRAEGDHIASATASSEAGGVVVGVGIGSRASLLEDLRVRRGFTGLRVAEAPRTAVPRGVERRARAPARHHRALLPGLHLQPNRTQAVQVAHAARVAAGATATLEGEDGDGEVVTVHKADVVEVLVSGEGDLGEGGRRGAAEAVALEGVAAVAGGAGSAAGGVKGAAMTPPDAAGPEGREGEGVSGSRRELETAAGENGPAGAGLESRPHRVLAFVVED